MTAPTNPTPTAPGPPGVPSPTDSRAAGADPLRLCVYATIALLGWLAGPFALAAFAGLGFVGYWRARRVGLMWSRCLLRDTRLVLAYLGVLVLAAGAGIATRLLGTGWW